MAQEHHEPQNPNAAPMHLEVKADFSRLQVAYAVGLAAIAVIAGLVLGIVLANS